MCIRDRCEEYKFDLDTPFEDYPKKIHDVLIYGTNGKTVKVYYKGQRGEGVYDVAFEGLIRSVERRYRETHSEDVYKRQGRCLRSMRQKIL